MRSRPHGGRRSDRLGRPRSGRLAAFGVRVAPPAVAYLAGQLLYDLAARHHDDWLTTGSRIRWDGGIYLDIARTGYYAAPCAEINPRLNDPDSICGNAGWFPLLPYLIRALRALTGIGYELAGVLIVEVCAFGMLVAVWQLLGATLTRRYIGCLAVAALLPSGVYFHATFPMSLSVLLALAMFLLLRADRPAAAGIVGAAAAFAYPLGILLAPAAFGYLLSTPDRPGLPARRGEPPGRDGWRQLRTAGYVAGLTGAGTVACFALLWRTTGRFGAYLDIQRRYTSGLHNPLRTFVTWIGQPSFAIRAEMVFSTGLVLLALLGLTVAVRARRATALDWSLAAGYGPLLFLVPLVIGASQSQYRAHTLLLPLVLLLRHLRTPVAAALALAGAPLAVEFTGLFLDRVLV